MMTNPGLSHTLRTETCHGLPHRPFSHESLFFKMPSNLQRETALHHRRFQSAPLRSPAQASLYSGME